MSPLPSKFVQASSFKNHPCLSILEVWRGTRRLNTIFNNSSKLFNEFVFSGVVCISRFSSYFSITKIISFLRWSRGSHPASGTQVRGFKLGRSRWIFQGEKNPQHGFLRRGVKPSVPCRRFTACKRSLNVTWKSGIFRQNLSAISRPCSSTFGW